MRVPRAAPQGAQVARSGIPGHLRCTGGTCHHAVLLCTRTALQWHVTGRECCMGRAPAVLRSIAWFGEAMQRHALLIALLQKRVLQLHGSSSAKQSSLQYNCCICHPGSCQSPDTFTALQAGQCRQCTARMCPWHDQRRKQLPNLGTQICLATGSLCTTVTIEGSILMMYQKAAAGS